MKMDLNLFKELLDNHKLEPEVGDEFTLQKNEDEDHILKLTVVDVKENIIFNTKTIEVKEEDDGTEFKTFELALGRESTREEKITEIKNYIKAHYLNQKELTGEQNYQLKRYVEWLNNFKYDLKVLEIFGDNTNLKQFTWAQEYVLKLNFHDFRKINFWMYREYSITPKRLWKKMEKWNKKIKNVSKK